MAPSSGLGVSAPVIRKLDEAVVNKIAAGEVIQRPASALKELLENSLDAGATQITVVVKEGGCKLLQITDNGHGIAKADLPILCHRHTTSKLKEFEDLETISTLGFRGEALCSISFVSNMMVTSMTANALHGWRVSYKDSEMVAPGAKAVASVQGTTISVEDLFYNVPTRRKALRSATEEYARVVDVVSRYAVFRTGVAFCCKRHGESRADVSTLAASSRLDNVRSVYGPAVAKELVPISVKLGQEVGRDMDVDAPCSFTLEGYVSSANYAAKSSTFILFVNERCVECPPLRKALEATYAAVLPKAARPFMLLDLRLPPRHVEVNMHPTKREVGMLNQEEVVDAIRSALEGLLTNSNTARTFAVQPTQLVPATIQQTIQQSQGERVRVKDLLLLPGPPGDAGQGGGPLREVQNESATERGGSQGAAGGGGGGGPAPYRPNKLVRVDGRAQSMEGFLSSQYATPRAAALAGSVGRKRGAGGEGRPSVPDMTFDPLATTPTPTVIDLASDELQGGAGGRGAQGSAGGRSVGGRGSRVGGAPLGVTCDLDSVKDLAAEVEGEAHDGLCELLRNHTLVGMADDTLALVQHQTKLYLVNVNNLSYDLFYQQVLRCWEHCGSIQLQPSPPVHDLMALALDLEVAAGKWKDVPGSSKAMVCRLASELMSEKRDMLAEYLNMQVDAQGCLLSLPELLPGHVPDLGYLPDLMLSLGRDVDWEEEEACFRGLAQVLAQFYSLKPPQMPVHSSQPAAATQPSDPLPLPLQPAGQQQDADDTAMDTTGVADTALDINMGDGSQAGQQQGLTAAQQPGAAAAAQGGGQQGGGGPAADSMDVDLVGVVPPLLELQPSEAVMQGAEEAQGAEGLQGVEEQQGRSRQGTEEVQGALAEQGGLQGLAAGGAAQQGAGNQQGGTSAQGLERWQVSEDEVGARNWMIKQVLFPAFRTLLKPGKHRASDGTFVMVTSLEKLYRIFERC